jgi:hypothetical protein
MEEVAFAASILAHDHRARRQVGSKPVQVPEVLNLNPSDVWITHEL